MKRKVIFLGPSRKAKGGITSVISCYEATEFWNRWNCMWIETYNDKTAIHKIYFFLKGLLVFIYNVWNSDIVHIHLSEPTSAIRKSFFFYIAYFLKRKIILHFHAFSSDSTLNGKFKLIYRNMFKKSDIVIVLSQFWQNEIVHTYGKNSVHIEVLYNPCIEFPQKLLISEREHYILYAGTLNKRKGYADLINAFSIVLKKHSDWKLILAGNGELEKGMSLAKSLDISNQVIFTGWVSCEKKENLFLRASIFCLPSYQEGFPMSLLEAISSGLPIITTPVGGILDIFSDGENALIFKPGDVAYLSNRLNLLIENELLRKQLMKASVYLASTTFSLDSIINKLDMIYLKLLNDNDNKESRII